MARARHEAWVVVDLGFGDAGKGTVTDFLVRRRGAHTVVRFNGGAQAGHNVVTADGRHHTFAQFGAGTFVPGVRTHLARQVVVHPLALLVEARRLDAAGVPDALARLTLSAAATVITPFQQAAGRVRELARDLVGREGRHGSCGVGVGEAVRDALALGPEALYARDLAAPTVLRRKLARLQEYKRAELAEELRAVAGDPAAEGERRVLEDPGAVDAVLDALAPFRARAYASACVVDDGHLGDLVRAPGAVVFEGAQGILLDEWRGLHPYTTWSTCTADNALALLADHGYEGRIARLGVLRAYATRHGPGPFPTEDAALAAALPEPHNATHAWQGAFRVGWPDPLLARYALAVTGGVNGLAVTHLDRLGAVPHWKACRGYRLAGAADLTVTLPPGPWQDLAYQEALTRGLSAAEPVYEPLPLPAGAGAREEAYLAHTARALGAPVWLASAGPTAADKRLLGDAPGALDE